MTKLGDSIRYWSMKWSSFYHVCFILFWIFFGEIQLKSISVWIFHSIQIIFSKWMLDCVFFEFIYSLSFRQSSWNSSFFYHLFISKIRFIYQTAYPLIPLTHKKKEFIFSNEIPFVLCLSEFSSFAWRI